MYDGAELFTTRFTGKERDSETGLDYLGARYYGSSMGRFLSPDEFTGGPVSAFGGDPTPPGPLPYADITNPQSLNKYNYAYNNPLRYIDPDGHLAEDGDEKRGHDGVSGLARDWLDVVEVNGSVGLGVGVGGQAGVAEYRLEATALGVEGTIGLGGGNGDAKALSEFTAHGKVGPVEGTVKAGGEVSIREGANAQAKVEGGVGEAKVGVGVDKNGVSTSAGISKDADVKLGAKVKVGIGAGVNVNASQAGRAWDRTVQSVQSLGRYLVNKLLPNGLPKD